MSRPPTDRSMEFDLRRRRPAVPAAVGLLAGTCSGWDAGATAVWGVGAGILAFAVWCPSALGRRWGWFALVGGFLIGAGLPNEPPSVPRRWLQAGLPTNGVALEAHVEGLLLRPVESDLEGGRWITLLARIEPERDPGPVHASAADALRLRLRVAPSPDGPSRALDRLGVGDRLRLWCRLRLPRRAGNPGSADPLRWLVAANVDGVGTVKSARLVERRDGGSPGPRRLAGRLRSAASERLDELLGDDREARGLAGAILLGERRRLPRDTTRRLRAAGLSHLIAISGLHVGVVVLLSISVFRVAGCRGWTLLALAVPGLTLFTLIVGARPSVLRAAIAAVLFLCARALGRDGDALNGVAAILALLLSIGPASATQPGFQLTFLATAGILGLAGDVERHLPLPGWMRSASSMTIAAYVATAPAVAAWFGMLAPVGLLTNLPAVPLCAVILVSGYAAVLLGDCFLIGPPCVTALRLSVEGILQIGRLGEAWPQAARFVPAPAVATIALAYGLLLLAVVSRGAPARRRWATLGLLLVLTWIHLGPPPPAPDGRRRIAVIDVGQGQAVAVKGARGDIALIDAGGSYGGYDPGEREVVPFLRRWGGARVDRLVLTHGHLDHSGGAAAVVRSLEVGELWIGGGAFRNPRVREVADAVRASGGAVVQVARGHVGRSNGVRLEVLWPRREGTHRLENESSVVVRVGEEPTRLLVPGDIGVRTETRLADLLPGPASEALLLSHHGSRHGSIRSFLEGVAPRVAIVSCGRGNPFGHPDDAALRRVAAVGATIYRTDVSGMLLLEQTPVGWRVRSPGSGGR